MLGPAKTTVTEAAVELKDGKPISFTYKNWRGESSRRTALPLRIWYGSSEWHPENQWFLRAHDMEKGEERDFALADIVFKKTS
jgi:predicted DNA-binding transcriptional regulator YafY